MLASATYDQLVQHLMQRNVSEEARFRAGGLGPVKAVGATWNRRSGLAERRQPRRR